MSLIDGKPMQYSDIANGNFDQMLQGAFLKAHKMANEYNQKVEVVASIQVFPPDPRVPNSGNVSFSVQLKEPKYVSQKFTTALVGGVPVNDGKNAAEAEQYNMFDRPEVIEDNNNNNPEVIE
jgi:hypothetical protein